jgi:hypothetical protein
MLNPIHTQNNRLWFIYGCNYMRYGRWKIISLQAIVFWQRPDKTAYNLLIYAEYFLYSFIMKAIRGGGDFQMIRLYK